jgi:Flp pilus assembly protein TadG
MKLEKTFQTATTRKLLQKRSSRREEAPTSLKNEPRCLGCYEGLKADPARQSGAVMLEFVIAFPLVLVLMFACIQFSEIWIARMVVHYGAFCAARTALVCQTSEYNGNNSAPSRAASTNCALLQQSWPLRLGDSPADRNSTQVEDSPTWNVTATTTYTNSLITPIVGQIIAWGMNPWDTNSPWSTNGFTGNIDSLGYPTIPLVESVTLPKPYKTMVPSGL